MYNFFLRRFLKYTIKYIKFCIKGNLVNLFWVLKFHIERNYFLKNWLKICILEIFHKFICLNRKYEEYFFLENSL